MINLLTPLTACIMIIFCTQKSTRVHEHPGFIVRLILDGSAIRYEPDFSDFQVVLLNVYDVIVKTVGVVPRVETKLYAEWVSYDLCNN